MDPPELGAVLVHTSQSHAGQVPTVPLQSLCPGCTCQSLRTNFLDDQSQSESCELRDSRHLYAAPRPAPN